MEFDTTYNCHCVLRLNTVREIALDKFTQSRAYAGLLMGTPNIRSNDHLIQCALDHAAKDNSANGKPYLITPERRDYFREPGDMRYLLEHQQDRPDDMKHIPEWLPQIACVGVFRSNRPARDTTKDASSLTIVWYQDDFGFDPKALDQLRLIDWDRYATDWEY